MDYKKIIKSRDMRKKILYWLNWVPDWIMIPLQYKIHTGHTLHLKNPKRFTEKLQVYKLKYRNPTMLRCTDKYEVRSYLEEKGQGKYLIPLIGVYNHAEDIDFDALPQQFVAKTTDGGGGNRVFICKDKSKVKAEDFMDKMKKWMVEPKGLHSGREWAYENHYSRRIVIEELIGDIDDIMSKKYDNELIDYKFFCFNGKVFYVYGVNDRHVGISAQFGIYDRDFNKLDVDRLDERHQEVALSKPLNYEQMLDLAEHLSEDFPHVRVDLYNVNGQIYFGELTFYDGSGYMQYSPDSFDFEMGEKFRIPFN